jgi:endonuclease III
MAPDDAETEALLARAGGGDGAAGQELLARHRQRLRRLVALRLDRRLAARVDPSDVVQDALAEAARKVPATMEELVPLPGIGRKTANVILGTAFGVPGIPVDTHVSRLSRRMGLTEETDPVKLEHDLTQLVPKKEWIMFGHRMIFHGRLVCHARKPLCEQCPLAEVCSRVGV